MFLEQAKAWIPGTERAPTHSHPVPFDEVYYILRGEGMIYLNASGDPYPLSPRTVAFVPGGTPHSLFNRGTTNLEMLTIMPGPLVEGVNPLYDERKAAWGTSFRLQEKPKSE